MDSEGGRREGDRRVSAQPIPHLRALQPLTDAIHAVENANREPTLDWWRDLAMKLRAARSELLKQEPDPLVSRVMFLCAGIVETTVIQTYMVDGQPVPHAHVKPGDEHMNSLFIDELHRLGAAAMLARVHR